MNYLKSVLVSLVIIITMPMHAQLHHWAKSVTSLSDSIASLHTIKLVNGGASYYQIRNHAMASRANVIALDSFGNSYVSGFYASPMLMDSTRYNNGDNFYFSKIDFYGNTQWVKTHWANFPINVLDIVPVHSNRFILYANVLQDAMDGWHNYDVKICLRKQHTPISTTDTITFESSSRGSGGGFFIVEFDSMGNIQHHQKIYDFLSPSVSTEWNFQMPNGNAFVDRSGCLIFMISQSMSDGVIYTRNHVIPNTPQSGLAILKFSGNLDSLHWKKELSDFGLPPGARGMQPRIRSDTNDYIYLVTNASNTFQFKGASYDVGLRSSFYAKGFLTILKPNAEVLYSEFFSQFDNREFRRSRDGILDVYPIDTNEIYINGFFPDTLRILGQSYYRENIQNPDNPLITNPNQSGYGRYSSLCLLKMGIHKVQWVRIPQKKVDHGNSSLLFPVKPQDLLNYPVISNFKNGIYTSFNGSRNTDMNMGGMSIDLEKEEVPKIVFAKFDTLGNALWLTQGVGIKGMQVTDLGELVYGGNYMDSLVFEPFSIYAGHPSGFVAKLLDYAITRGPVSAGPYCAGDSILVPYTKLGAYDTANWFVAELSDEYGQFEGRHRELGRLKTNQDSVIIGALPMFQVVSSGRYRIRVRATHPAVQSYYWEDTLQLLIYSRDKADPGPQEFLCLEDSLEIQTYGGTQWEWTPNQNIVDSSARKTMVFPTQTTTYRIVISDSSGCGQADTAYKKIIVRDYPVIVAKRNNFTACVGDTLRIPVSFSFGDTSQYHHQWFVISGIRWILGQTGHALLDDTFSFVVTANMPNTQRVALILTDHCHPRQDTVIFQLQRARNTPSPASISPSDSSLKCPQQRATLMAQIPDIPNMQWVWLNAWGDTLKSGSNATIDSLEVVPQFNQNQPETYRIVTLNNCVGRTDTASFQWFPPPLLKVFPQAIDTLVCAYNELTLYASGTGGDSNQYEYRWILNDSLMGTEPNITLKPFKSDILQLVLSDNCMPQNDTAKMVISVRPALQSAILRELQDDNPLVDTTICFGSELLLFAKGMGGDSINYSFEWLWNDSLISTQNTLHFTPPHPLFSTILQLSLILKDDCSIPDTNSINITILPPLEVSFTAIDTLCLGEAIVLFAQAKGGMESNYNYRWILNGNTIGTGDSLLFVSSPLHPSPSTLQLVLSDGCSSPNDTFTHTFFIRSLLNLSLSASTLCASPSATLSANPSGGTHESHVIQWFEASNLTSPIGTGFSIIVTPSQLTTYRAILSDGCSADTAFAQIQIDRLPSTLTLTATPTEGCEPLEVEFEINTNYSDTFSGILFVSDTDSLMIANPLGRMAISRLASGTYTPSFQFISKLGCTGETSFAPTITVHPKPMAAFRFEPDSPRLDHPEVRFLNLSTGAISYQWELPPLGIFTDIEPTVRYSETGRFSVMHIAISDQDCRDTAVGEVWIQKVLRFFMPNAFSPNGDGINDGFFPSVLGLEVMEFNIYNGWGERMFRSNGQAWDGTYRGLPVPSGVYTYILVLKEENGKQLHFSGTVTLIR